MMEIISMSDILETVIYNGMDDDSKRRAKVEEMNKMRRAYEIFEIDIVALRVKARYWINKKYTDTIKWILFYTSTYANKDKDIEDKRDVPIDMVQKFRDCEFDKIDEKSLEKLVSYMVDGLLAFNTEFLDDAQRKYLEQSVQKIYMCTRIYHRQLENRVSEAINNKKLIIDDKLMIYTYISHIFDKIGGFIEKLAHEIDDWRDAEEFNRACLEFEQLPDGGKVDDVIDMDKIESIVFESSINVLKDIITDMEEEVLNQMQESPKDDEFDLGLWLQENENLIQKPVIGQQYNHDEIQNQLDDIDFNIKYIEMRQDYLEEQSKKKHYTHKKIGQIKKELKELGIEKGNLQKEQKRFI